MAEKRIPESVVRALCGRVSEMTLSRWLNDLALHFPRPACLAKRRYRHGADLIAWWDAQGVKAVP